MTKHFLPAFLAIIFQMGFYFNANFRSMASSKPENCKTLNNIVKEENPILSPKDIIFEVKHSHSPNTVVYQANKTTKNLLDAQKPVDVYWLMNSKGKKVETLTAIEWKLAYGYKLKTLINGKKYKITINAIKEKEVTISLNEVGKVEAFMMIKGEYAKVSSVYIDFEYTLFLPVVNYVEFTGFSVGSNKKLVERIKSED